jgi:rhodanese-related sulfurtransferase
MRSLVIALVSALSLSACGQNKEAASTNQEVEGTTAVINATITIDEAEAKMKNPEVLILDVRTPDEFNQGHIEGAKNINVLDKTFGEKLAELTQDQVVVVYCRSGSRSAKAQGIMVEQGFTETYNVQGGIMAWQAKGKKVVK